MKNFLTILVMLFVMTGVVTFIGCGDDEPETTDPLVGTWTGETTINMGPDTTAPMLMTLVIAENAFTMDLEITDGDGNCQMEGQQSGTYTKTDTELNFTFTGYVMTPDGGTCADEMEAVASTEWEDYGVVDGARAYTLSEDGTTLTITEPGDTEATVFTKS